MRVTRAALAAGLFATAGVAIAATAAAVPVRGSLQVPRDLAPAARASADQPALFYWQERNGVIDAHPERVDVSRRMAVVLLGDAEERPDSSFRIWGGGLMPSTMVVQAGSNLRLQNTDGCSHELHAEGIEEFSPLQTAPGNARTLRVPAAAGAFAIRDRIYPHVEGHLHVVTDLAARAEVGADGRFTFADVRAGTYTLKVFYGEHEIASRPVEVVEGRELALEEPVPLTIPAAR